MNRARAARAARRTQLVAELKEVRCGDRPPRWMRWPHFLKVPGHVIPKLGSQLRPQHRPLRAAPRGLPRHPQGDAPARHRALAVRAEVEGPERVVKLQPGRVYSMADIEPGAVAVHPRGRSLLPPSAGLAGGCRGAVVRPPLHSWIVAPTAGASGRSSHWRRSIARQLRVSAGSGELVSASAHQARSASDSVGSASSAFRRERTGSQGETILHGTGDLGCGRESYAARGRLAPLPKAVPVPDLAR